MSTPPGTRLMMTTDTVGGVWTFAANLVRALGAAGFEVLLVTLGPRPSAAQRAMVCGYPGISLTETDLTLEWQDPSGTDVAHARSALHDIADHFAPEIVHLNSFREATYVWNVPTVVVAHSCVNSWAAACGERDAFTGHEWSTYTANVRAGLRQASAWVAPTSAFRDQLAQHYGLDASGDVIWNGVDGVADRSQPKRPVVLSAGRVWDKAKNLTALASIASTLDWPVRIAGTSEAGGGATAGSSVGCQFLGELPHQELLAEFEAASIFVSPALYEPFGLSVLEAASAGCALVLSDIPTFRELWDDAALFFDPRDKDAMIGCLRSLCADDAQQASLQRAASERAGRYRLRSTVDAYRSLYRKLLAAGSALSPMLEGEEVIA
jgi:glycosyltransferase involved in cell wall biosynthesis